MIYSQATTLSRQHRTCKMTSLPPPKDLKRRCQALAALDLILSPQWENRSYFFDSMWAAQKELGSMRNGSGDEWFCLFDASGWAGLKGIQHESTAWEKGGQDLSEALQRETPADLSGFCVEPAFNWNDTSFAFYARGGNSSWIRLNDETEFSDLTQTGEKEMLSLLMGSPRLYVEYANEYFEMALDEGAVKTVFSLSPISESILSRLNPHTQLSLIAEELFGKIAYPRG
jgi:hypothetical protein